MKILSYDPPHIRVGWALFFDMITAYMEIIIDDTSRYTAHPQVPFMFYKSNGKPVGHKRALRIHNLLIAHTIARHEKEIEQYQESMETLHQKLREAIEVEDFEKAARLKRRLDELGE